LPKSPVLPKSPKLKAPTQNQISSWDKATKEGWKTDFNFGISGDLGNFGNRA